MEIQSDLSIIRKRYTQEVLDNMNKLTKDDVVYIYDFVVTSDCDIGERKLSDRLYYHYTDQYIIRER